MLAKKDTMCENYDHLLAVAWWITVKAPELLLFYWEEPSYVVLEINSLFMNLGNMGNGGRFIFTLFYILLVYYLYTKVVKTDRTHIGMKYTLHNYLEKVSQSKDFHRLYGKDI